MTAAAAMPPLALVLVMLLTAAHRVRPSLDGGSAAVHPEAAATATGVWSKFGLVVQKHADGQSTPHTTETSGIIMRAPDPPVPGVSTPLASPPTVGPTALGKSWTQISVTHPPLRPLQHHSLVKSTTTTTTTARSAVATSTHEARRDIPYRYQPLMSTTKPIITITFPPPRLSTARPTVGTEEVTSKRVRQYEDDDDDDDDDEDDDEDEYDVDDDEDHEDKGEEEEIEEIVEVQHIDSSDGYGEEKPAIVKKKRRRKKKGKKHKPFKVKDFKKLKKFMLPLLLAYKLKFFTLVPLMLGGLVLIVATTGFAGFFFALFAVGLGLKGHH